MRRGLSLERNLSFNKPVDNEVKIDQNRGGGKISHFSPPSTTTNQLDSYTTVRNIEIETSHKEKNWPKFVFKELLDNAYDWLNDLYPENDFDINYRKIDSKIWITNSYDNSFRFLHIAVRNSNKDKVQIFPDLDKTFDFYSWNSTKRDQHRMSTGGLGDALKRCLGMGTYNLDPEAFEERQWDEPLIMRFNGSEYNVFIRMDRSKPKPVYAEIKKLDHPTADLDFGDGTEVVVTLPVNLTYGWELQENVDSWKFEFMKYLKAYKIVKFHTDFTLSCDLHVQGQQKKKEDYN
jgi:hypothetical protein